MLTGANTGIGIETVKALMRSETIYNIILCGRDIKKAERAAEAVKAEIQSKSSIETLQVDVESDESISSAFSTVSAKHEKLDVLVNNAGMLCHSTQSSEYRLTRDRRILRWTRR